MATSSFDKKFVISKDGWKNLIEAQNNTSCNFCNGKFNSQNITIKSHREYEGLDVLVFDCPVCGKETDDLQCN